MIRLVDLFSNNLLPTLIIAGTGFWIGRTLKVQPRTFSLATFYLFSPCLLFDLMISNPLQGDEVARIVALSVSISLLSGLAAWAIGKALRVEKRLLVALLITCMFVNSGNLGLPVTLFAFGEKALAHASLYFVTNLILISTLGVVIASYGSDDGEHPLRLRRALLTLFKVPAPYALGLAMWVNASGWVLPLPLTRTVELLSDASIPCMLILSGLQIQAARRITQAAALVVPNLVRLVLAPLLALGLSALMGLQGPARQAGIFQSGMPTAVMSTILATEYDVEPSFVTMVVFTSTLLSPFSLTFLMAFLGA